MKPRTPEFADHVDRDEAGYVERGVALFRNDPGFRAITRLVRSRVDQKQPVEPLRDAILAEIWKAILNDAGLA